MNPLEIVGRTPKSNCGECGFPTCLAFGAAVCATGLDPHKCPYLDLEGLEIEVAGVELEDVARQRDLALVEHLQGKISESDFKKLAPKLGARLHDTQPETLIFPYLGQEVELAKNDILLDCEAPEDPRDQILLYNYVYSGGGRQPDGEWLGMESMPNSISKVRTLFTYCEDPLARLFTGRRPALLIEKAALAGGCPVEGTSASLALRFDVLPMLPQLVLFWEAESDDGFEAKVKILFDHHALDFLDIESLLFSAERLAERMVKLFAK